MTETTEYIVPGMHCGHRKVAVEEELSHARGVESVEVDLETKLVVVRGTHLDDSELRAALEEVGYGAA